MIGTVSLIGMSEVDGDVDVDRDRDVHRDSTRTGPWISIVVSKLWLIGIVVLIGTSTVRLITTSVSIGIISSIATSNSIVE